ncbi:homoserine dehydrogenase [bacterium]
MKTINIGIVGLGTVGTGVVKILNRISKDVQQKVGAKINIKTIVTLDRSRTKEVNLKNVKISKNYNDILNDKEIDIIVELIGGYEPARTMIIDALRAGKHVVTANKAVMAKYWDEIHALSIKKGLLVYFEASVGGAIPIIQGINEGLAANKINAIHGILNGTTNYILTKMLEEHTTFEDALKDAQRLGFAEADPTMDVKGTDAVHKLAILASIASGSSISFKDIYSEGIDNIDVQDVLFAKHEFDLVLKLIAIMKREKDSFELRVHPTLISSDHLLASVKNEFNAVFVDGDATGKTMFYGKGAGQLPAASAVTSDIIYVARHIANDTAGMLPLIAYDKEKKVKINSINDIESKYYLRFTVVDKPGVIAKIAGVLGKNNVSIESFVQKANIKTKVPVIMTTHTANEKNIRKALSEINRLSFIKAKTVLLRIEEV